MSAPPEDDDLLDEETGQSAQSELYVSFLAEREQVLRHKWLMSEESGDDVGLDAALLDWAQNHRAAWKASISNDLK